MVSYTKWLLKQTFDSFETRNSNYDKNIKDEKNKTFNIINLSDEAVNTKKLQYKGGHGIIFVKSIKTSTKKTSPDDHDVRSILTDNQLSWYFNIKDDTNKQTKNDLIHYLH